MFKELFFEDDYYKLIDKKGNEVKWFKFNGDIMRVEDVYQDAVLAISPAGSYIKLSLNSIKSQDKSIKGII